MICNSPEPEIKKQVIDKLCSWQNMCLRSAIYVLTHQFIQDQIGELFYMSEAIKLKFSSIHKDADGVLTTSRENTTYQVLANHFKKQGCVCSPVFVFIAASGRLRCSRRTSLHVFNCIDQSK